MAIKKVSKHGSGKKKRKEWESQVYGIDPMLPIGYSAQEREEIRRLEQYFIEGGDSTIESDRLPEL